MRKTKQETVEAEMKKQKANTGRKSFYQWLACTSDKLMKAHPGMTIVFNSETGEVICLSGPSDSPMDKLNRLQDSVAKLPKGVVPVIVGPEQKGRLALKITMVGLPGGADE